MEAKHALTTYSRDSVSIEFASYDDYMKDFETLKVEHPEHRKAHGYEFNRPDRNQSWYGCAGGFDDTAYLIEHGWPELRQRMEYMTAGIELELPVYPSQTQTRRRKMRWQEDGSELNLQRVWSGNIDTAWRKPVRTQKLGANTKRITLAFDVTDNASVTNDQALWRAAVSLLLCDSLAKAGRIFEVYAMDSTDRPYMDYNAPRRMYASICIKQSSDPLVLDRLCSMLSIGMLRTAFFMVQRMTKHVPSHGLGHAAHSGLPHSLDERRANGEVVLRIAGCYDKASAIREYERAWEEVEAQTGKDEEAA